MGAGAVNFWGVLLHIFGMETMLWAGRQNLLGGPLFPLGNSVHSVNRGRR